MGNLNKNMAEDLKRIKESKQETIKRAKKDFEELKKNIPNIKDRAEKAKQRILKDLNKEK